MDAKEVKVGGFQDENHRGSRMSPARRPKLTKFITDCNLYKLLVFAFLCSLAGSLLTICIRGDGIYTGPPNDQNIRAAFEHCFRTRSRIHCDDLFSKALADSIHEHNPWDEVKLVDLLVWQELYRTAAEMNNAIEKKNPEAVMKALHKMLDQLNAGISQL